MARPSGDPVDLSGPGSAATPREDRFTRMLLDEVADSFARRRHVAQVYAAAIRYQADVDWTRVNAAVIERWSESALVWIKQEAWKLV